MGTMLPVIIAGYRNKTPSISILLNDHAALAICPLIFPHGYWHQFGHYRRVPTLRCKLLTGNLFLSSSKLTIPPSKDALDTPQLKQEVALPTWASSVNHRTF